MDINKINSFCTNTKEDQAPNQIFRAKTHNRSKHHSCLKASVLGAIHAQLVFSILLYTNILPWKWADTGGSKWAGLFTQHD